MNFILKQEVNRNLSYKENFHQVTFVRGNEDVSLVKPQTVVFIYHSLCDAIAMANKTFNFVLTFLICHFFFYNIVSLFNHVWTFMKDFDNLRFLVVTETSWLMINYVFIGLLITSSCSMTQQAEQTAIIVNQIVISSETDKRHQEIYKNFLLQIPHRNRNMRNQFYNINFKLVIAVSRYQKS